MVNKFVIKLFYFSNSDLQLPNFIGNIQSASVLPWQRGQSSMVNDSHAIDDLNPGEYVLQTLFSEFTVLAEKKIDRLMKESLVSCAAVLLRTLENVYGGACLRK